MQRRGRPGECMKVTWTELEVPGLLLSSGASVQDQRGSFTKVLSGTDSVLGNFEGKELYWTSSARGVLRGLHFQLPPAATRKLVYVVNGAIRDFIVDLRVGSPMERELFEMELNPGVGGLLVPVGCAHAYEALEDNTVVCYAQDVPFSDLDSYGGIRAETAGIIPQTSEPILLQRDLAFPALDEFESPFFI